MYHNVILLLADAVRLKSWYKCGLYLEFIINPGFLHFFCYQESALSLGVLTEKEFHELVVPEKMIGPSD